MQGEILSGVLLPAALCFIMFALGLGLTVADFRSIVRQPKALVVGLVCHFVVLPAVAYGLVVNAGLPPAFAVGFMVIAACPTGSTSNLLTYVARGDVALAVSFTAVASVLTVFTLPLVVSAAMRVFLGQSATVAVPLPAIMVQVFVLLGLPVGAGMFWRHRWPASAKVFEKHATRIATALFFAIMAAAIARNWALLRDNFRALAPLAVTLNVAMLLVGFAAAWLVRLPRRQAVTLGIESAIQNAALALVVASSLLKSDEMVVPGAVYGSLMYAGGLVFALAMRGFATASPTSSADSRSARA